MVFTAWPQLARWLEEVRAELVLDRELRRDADAWDAADRDTDYLYRGARLAAAEELLVRRDVDGLVSEFVVASTTAAERAAEERARHQARVNRRLRGLLTGVAVLLVVALLAGVLAMRQADRADESAAAATAEALRADALRLGDRALVTTEADLALLLAVAGVRLLDAPETRANLLAALTHASRPWSSLSEASYRGWSLPIRHALDSSPTRIDGSSCVTPTASRSWPGPPRSLPVRFQSHVDFSPDGEQLAVIHDGYDEIRRVGTVAKHPVVLYDTETLAAAPAARQLGGVPPSAAGLDIAYSADGRYVAVSFVRSWGPAASPIRRLLRSGSGTSLHQINRSPS